VARWDVPPPLRLSVQFGDKSGRMFCKSLRALYQPYHAKDASKIRSSPENLRHLWPPIHVAQEMGKGLGRSALLLRSLQK
jgi:hypothetical protein